MKLYLINSKGKFDISQLTTSITWSGEKKQVARMLEFGVIHSTSDKSIPKVQIDLGNKVQFLDDKGELFRGYIWSKEKSSNADEMKFTAYDIGIGLVKNKVVFNFKNKSPEEIVKTVCASIGCPTGDIKTTGIKLSRIFNGVSAYEVIQSAYTIASNKNGKKYMPLVDKDKLNIIEKGSKVVPFTIQQFDNTTGEGNLIGSTFSETLEGMVNKVLIVDDKGKVVSSVKNDENIKLYGTLQEIYKQEKDKNSKAEAKNLLKGVERTASLEAIGNSECITGHAVMVKDTSTGLIGKFFIDSDSHTFENDKHMMNLTITFENMMDSVEAGEIEQK